MYLADVSVINVGSHSRFVLTSHLNSPVATHSIANGSGTCSFIWILTSPKVLFSCAKPFVSSPLTWNKSELSIVWILIGELKLQQSLYNMYVSPHMPTGMSHLRVVLRSCVLCACVTVCAWIAAGSGTRTRRMWFIHGAFLSKPPFLPFSGDLGAYEEAGLDLHLPLTRARTTTIPCWIETLFSFVLFFPLQQPLSLCVCICWTLNVSYSALYYFCRCVAAEKCGAPGFMPRLWGTTVPVQVHHYNKLA